MIKNIILDLGNVLIPLKIRKARLNFMKMGLFYIPKSLKETFSLYQKGLLSSKEFILVLKKNTYLGNEKKIITAWNSILGDFKLEIFEILRQVKEKGYHLFLLSNLNELHLNEIIKNMGNENYKKFRDLFTKMYFSHHIGLIKPQKEIFGHVLNENQILASESLFVDDLKENILSAKSLNLHTWHFNPKKDSLTKLKEKI